MTTNLNLKTGYWFGLLDGRDAMELLTHIQDHGRNESYESWKKHTRDSIEGALADYDAEDPIEDLYYRLARVLQNHCPDSDAREIVQEARALVDPESNTFDIDEVADAAMERLMESYEADEEIHTLVEGGCSYETTWFGGYPSIWCFDSPFLTPCRMMGVCMANTGGDLDDTTTIDEGHLTHCPPPEDWGGWKEIYRITPEGPVLVARKETDDEA